MLEKIKLPIFKRHAFLSIILVLLIAACIFFVFAGREAIAPRKNDYHNYITLASSGDAEAQNNLGTLYMHDEKVIENYEEAAKWFEKAASQGHPIAQKNLGILFERGWGVEKNLDRAFQFYKLAAGQGNVQAIKDIGRFHYNGISTEKNEEEGLKLLDRAAHLGEPYAQNFIGIRYENGEHYTQDLSAAQEWYLKAAQQGYPEAQFNLARTLEKYASKDADFIESGRWYKKSSEANLVFAKERLSQIKEECITPKNLDGSNNYPIRQCFIAAGAEDPAGMHAAGIAYYYGRGEVPINKDDGFAWLLKSARAGHSGAQVHLGIIYQKGEEARKSALESYAWFSVAEGAIDLTALQKQVIKAGKKSALDLISPDEIKKAHRTAEDYIKAYRI